MRAQGIDPYPVGVRVPDSLAGVVAAWDGKLEPGEETDHAVTVGGRMVRRRRHGKLVFATLREGDTDLQVLAEAATLGAEGMAFLDDLDVGDWLAVEGTVVRSRRGELSVRPVRSRCSRRPCGRCPTSGTAWSTPTRATGSATSTSSPTRRPGVCSRCGPAPSPPLRAELLDRSYVEVETPVLQLIASGGHATPFLTHHEALGLDLYLRIALELHLKRLVAGGMPRVFEIGRTFRNEGLSPRHNPEFTMLETYEAYADYGDVMALTQALVQRAARDAIGTLQLTYGDRPVDLGGDWPRRTVLNLVREAAGAPDLSYGDALTDVRALCDRHGVPYEPAWGVGKLVLELYESLVEGSLWDPTFVIDYPVEVSPLARRHRTDPDVTERFELIVVGRELANAFSELNDPDDQRARLEAQVKAKAAGDAEAMPIDEDFLRAMEYGMPPMGGLGIGVDRLVMLLADVQTIRDVILFPTLRPEA